MRIDKLTSKYESNNNPEKRDMQNFYNEINEQDDLFYPDQEYYQQLLEQNKKRIR